VKSDYPRSREYSARRASAPLEGSGTSGHREASPGRGESFTLVTLLARRNRPRQRRRSAQPTRRFPRRSCLGRGAYRHARSPAVARGADPRSGSLLIEHGIATVLRESVGWGSTSQGLSPHLDDDGTRIPARCSPTVPPHTLMNSSKHGGDGSRELALRQAPPALEV